VIFRVSPGQEFPENAPGTPRFEVAWKSPYKQAPQMPKSGQKGSKVTQKEAPEKGPSRVFKVPVILDWLYDALQLRGRC